MIGAQNEKKVMIFAPVAKTNTATASATFDVLGADYATIVVSMSSELNTNAVGPTLSLAACDTSNGSFVTLTADRAAEDLTAGKQVIYNVDLRTKKRYLSLAVTTATATNDNVTVAATAILSRLEQGPSSTTYEVGSTNDVVVAVT